MDMKLSEYIILILQRIKDETSTSVDMEKPYCLSP